MEFLSPSQLQKYEEIIDQMKYHFEKYDKLKTELEEEDNKVIVSHLANSKLCEKVSHVNVKVFSDISELYNLYAGELEEGCHKFTNFCNTKFYLLEIYVSKPLIQKVKNLNWSINISVKTETVHINKTLNIPRKIPVLDVIPVDQNVINCVIETSLIFPSTNKWMVIKLDTVDIDISYHFQTYKEKRKGNSNDTNILQIAKCYNEALNIEELEAKPMVLEYKMMCDIEKTNFIQSILRNSYHKLDIEQFSQFENEGEFILPFSSGAEKYKLIYNKREKILTIKTNLNELHLLKKYLLKEFHCRSTNRNICHTDIKIKENVSENSQEATLFYNVLRKTWVRLPV